MQRNLREHSFYLKLENKLREDILSGALPAGQSIPSEPELCRQFALSRTTVRKAIQRLVDRNFLRRAHGSGTFVIPAEDRARMPRQLVKIRILGSAEAFDPETMDIFDKNIFLGADSFARLNNCALEWCHNAVSPEKLLADYHNFLFDGLIWVRGDEAQLDKAQQLRKYSVPQVLIARDLEQVPGIYFDSVKAMDDLCHFLRTLGHRKIGFVDLKSPLPVFQERQNTFVRACSANHVQGELCAIDFYRSDLIAAFLRESRPTALLCAGLVEPYLHEAVHELRLRIPEDLSLIRLSPTPVEYDHVSCTELRMPVFEMGFKAAETLLGSNFLEPQTLRDRVLVPGEIVVRRSIAQPNQKD